MNKFHSLLAAAAVWLCGCQMTDLDLTDIDTTTRLAVNDLTIPIQIDEMTLDDLLDLSADSKLKKNAQGEYMFLEEGTFASDPISVKKFDVSGSESSTSASCDITYLVGGTAPHAAATMIGYADIPRKAINIDYTSDGVDKSVVDVDYIGGRTNISLTLQFNGLTSVLNRLRVRYLKIRLVKGLDLTPSLGSYDPETGILSIDDMHTDQQHALTMNFTLNGVDTKKAGVTLVDGNFHFDTDAAIIDGHIELQKDDLRMPNPKNLPSSIGFVFRALVGDLTVDRFSGKVRYDIANVNIAPIKLDNLPGFISQDGTNIILDNPQLYISVNNPLRQAGYPLNAQFGVAFKKWLSTEWLAADQLVALDAPLNELCLSPRKPATYYNGKAETKHVPYANLSNIVSGNAVPRQIDVDIISPCIPVQQVQNFRLGEALNPVSGHWTFMAPIAMKQGSRIVYIHEWDDLGSDDLDALTIDRAAVSATIKSDVEIDLSARLTISGKQGQMQTADITLHKGDNDINIQLDGQITGLDKAYIVVNALGTGQALHSEQKITISNFKATVNGYYEKEF